MFGVNQSGLSSRLEISNGYMYSLEI